MSRMSAPLSPQACVLVMMHRKLNEGVTVTALSLHVQTVFFPSVTQPAKMGSLVCLLLSPSSMSG